MANQYHLTPEELMIKYPAAARLGWTAAKIGVFYSGGLLQGYHCSSERKNLIEEESFLRLIDYANDLLRSRIVDYRNNSKK